MKTDTTHRKPVRETAKVRASAKATRQSAKATRDHAKPSRYDAKRVATGSPVQLRLLEGGTAQPDWVLDERTRRVGRQGVAQAREILRRVAPPEPIRQAS